MMSLNKRKFIKNTITILFAAAFANAFKVLAGWPRELFTSKNSQKIIKSLANDSSIAENDLIMIKAPDIAENGGVVPVTVSTELDKVKKISILVENNPNPLTSSFDINDQLSPYVSTRVKMAKTSNITAIVATDNGYFRASRNIKVTIGGCGG